MQASKPQVITILNLRRELGLRPLSVAQSDSISQKIAHVMIQDMLYLKSTIGGKIHA